MFEILFYAALLPLGLVGSLIGNRAIPLPQRSLSRATTASFVLTFLATAANSVPLDPRMTVPALIIGAVALLYLVVGARNARGMQLDVIELIVVACIGLFFAWLRLAQLYPPFLTPFLRALVAALYGAACAAAVVRVGLMLRPAPSASLADPATVPGMPMAGPASLGAAAAAMSRRGNAARPKFRT
jgi:apolipoprotein N-acyltransferase